MLWRFARRLAFAVCAIAAYVVLARLYALNAAAVPWLLVALLIAVVGLLVLARAPRAPLNRAFACLCAFLVAYLLMVFLLTLATTVGLDRVRTAVWALRMPFLLGPVALMYFVRHFVDARSRLLRLLPWLALASALPFLGLNLFHRYITEYRLHGTTWVPANHLGLYKLWFGLSIAWLVLAAAVVLRQFLRSPQRSRRGQYGLFLGGWVASTICGFAGYLPAFTSMKFPGFAAFTWLIFPTALAVAVARFGLFEIKIVIRRTLPYAVGTALVGGLYALCLAGLQAVGSGLDVLPRGTGLVVLLVLVGLAFQPILEGLQKGLDRLFFRAEAGLDSFLAMAGARYLGATSEGALARMVVADAVDALRLEGGALLLGPDRIAAVTAEGGAGALKAAAGLPMPAGPAGREPLLPDESGRFALGAGFDHLADMLAANGILIAVPFGAGPGRALLACQQKRSHLPFTPRDRMFLGALAAQAETALSRLQARRDAEAANRLTEAVFESMTNAVALVAPDGRVTGCNPAFERAFGIAGGRGMPPAAVASMRDVERSGGTREVETPHGTFLVSARRLEGPDGVTLAVLTDITELRRLQEADRKRAALAELGTTISSINHEIGNILSPLSHQIGKIAQAGSLEEVARPVQVARDRVAALERLGRELREFYREPQLAPRRVRLRDAVEGALSDLRVPAGGAWVPPELSGLDLEVTADIQKLKQVLLNVLKNAWEAMQEQSVKTWAVSARVDGTRAVITVRDSGPGIPPGLRGRLFQPFFTTKKERGTGLGLAIARRIVEAHGAEIAVESAAGGGTAFAIRWPLAG